MPEVKLRSAILCPEFKRVAPAHVANGIREMPGRIKDMVSEKAGPDVLIRTRIGGVNRVSVAGKIDAGEGAVLTRVGRQAERGGIKWIRSVPVGNIVAGKADV